MSSLPTRKGKKKGNKNNQNFQSESFQSEPIQEEVQISSLSSIEQEIPFDFKQKIKSFQECKAAYYTQLEKVYNEIIEKDSYLDATKIISSYAFRYIKKCVPVKTAKNVAVSVTSSAAAHIAAKVRACNETYEYNNFYDSSLGASSIDNSSDEMSIAQGFSSIRKEEFAESTPAPHNFQIRVHNCKISLCSDEPKKSPLNVAESFRDDDYANVILHLSIEDFELNLNRYPLYWVFLSLEKENESTTSSQPNDLQLRLLRLLKNLHSGILTQKLTLSIFRFRVFDKVENSPYEFLLQEGNYTTQDGRALIRLELAQALRTPPHLVKYSEEQVNLYPCPSYGQNYSSIQKDLLQHYFWFNVDPIRLSVHQVTLDSLSTLANSIEAYNITCYTISNYEEVKSQLEEWNRTTCVWCGEDRSGKDFNTDHDIPAYPLCSESFQSTKSTLASSIDLHIHYKSLLHFCYSESFYTSYKIRPIDVKIDYEPRCLDLSRIKEGSLVELVNLLAHVCTVNDFPFHLETVEVDNFTGINQAITVTMNSWLQDFKRSHLKNCARGIKTVGPAVRLTEYGAQQLIRLCVLTPKTLLSHKNDEGPLTETTTLILKSSLAPASINSMINFSKNCLADGLELTDQLISTAHKVLAKTHAYCIQKALPEKAPELQSILFKNDPIKDLVCTDEEMIGNSATNMRLKEWNIIEAGAPVLTQPQSAWEGMIRGSHTLQRSAAETKAIVDFFGDSIPKEVSLKTAQQIACCLPIVILQPLLGLASSIQLICQGFNNELEPIKTKRKQAKFRTPFVRSVDYIFENTDLSDENSQTSLISKNSKTGENPVTNDVSQNII